MTLGLVEFISEAEVERLFLGLNHNVSKLLNEVVHLLVNVFALNRVNRVAGVEGIQYCSNTVSDSNSIDRLNALSNQVRILPRNPGTKVGNDLVFVVGFNLSPNVLHAVKVWAVRQVVKDGDPEVIGSVLGIISGEARTIVTKDYDVVTWRIPFESLEENNHILLFDACSFFSHVVDKTVLGCSCCEA